MKRSGLARLLFALWIAGIPLMVVGCSSEENPPATTTTTTPATPGTAPPATPAPETPPATPATK